MTELTGVRKEAFSYYRRLDRVRRYVRTHIGEPITLAEVAGIAGLERTYFSDFFHAKTGVCFRDWLSSVRVGHATELLRARNLSVTEVAFRAGFGDLRTFERACKRWAGMTPIQLKQKLRPRGRRTCRGASAERAPKPVAKAQISAEPRRPAR